jgi:guanylate kinase
VDGRDYHFVTRERFRELMAEGAFIEHADVYGNMYGTLRQPMEEALERGEVYLLEIDVQGALQLKTLGEPGIYVFIAPPDFVELRRRLTARNTEKPEVLERHGRPRTSGASAAKYHIVVNDLVERGGRDPAHRRLA